MYLNADSARTVQLAETKRGVKVWALDENGNKIEMKCDLKEGGYYRDSLK